MDSNPLDRYLSEAIRVQIEQAFYGRVNAQGQFEQLIQDPDFWQNPSRHPALFSDHGVVHVRDVAFHILQLLRTINGVLIPIRDQSRLDNFMYGYGVLAAYLHDIGMMDLSEFGRAMHPEFAAQAVFTGELDDVIEAMWAQNSGNVAGRLDQLARLCSLNRDSRIVFREALALSVCHSKRKVPIAVLNEPVSLRVHMQSILSHTLPELYRLQQGDQGKIHVSPNLDERSPQFLSRFYSDFEHQAFDWLIAGEDEARNLVLDVTDTLRTLRCADALRQRGAVQKTSGGYEVFVSQQTGSAVYALRLGNEKLYLLEMPDNPVSAGEANIASSEFSAEGNLHISFHRGAYANDEAMQRSAYYTAFTINDFLEDLVDSFRRGKIAKDRPLKLAGEIQILLESTDDNPRFTEMVQEQLRRFNPARGDQIQIAPSLQNVSELERLRFLSGQDLNWDIEQRRSALKHMEQSGHKIENIDIEEGFRHVKLVDLKAGETLIEASAPSAFVYFPLGNGLKVLPLGGYPPVSGPAWMPVGNTGVIRGALRNADVIAEQSVTLLMIPREVYLRYWYAPYTFEELKKIFLGRVRH